MPTNLQTGDITEPADAGSAFRKHDAGKPRFSLLPPAEVSDLIAVFELGASKYGDGNYANGADYSRYFDALMRHSLAWWQGEDTDPESGLSHMAHVSACSFILSAIHRDKTGKDNRPK